MNKLEDFLFSQIIGKIIARASLTIVAFLMGPQVQEAANAAGIHVQVDPNKFAEFCVLAAHAVYEMFKAWRIKNKSTGSTATAA